MIDAIMNMDAGWMIQSREFCCNLLIPGMVNKRHAEGQKEHGIMQFSGSLAHGLHVNVILIQVRQGKDQKLK